MSSWLIPLGNVAGQAGAAVGTAKQYLKQRAQEEQETKLRHLQAQLQLQRLQEEMKAWGTLSPEQRREYILGIHPTKPSYQSTTVYDATTKKWYEVTTTPEGQVVGKTELPGTPLSAWQTQEVTARQEALAKARNEQMMAMEDKRQANKIAFLTQKKKLSAGTGVSGKAAMQRYKQMGGEKIEAEIDQLEKELLKVQNERAKLAGLPEEMKQDYYTRESELQARINELYNQAATLAQQSGVGGPPRPWGVSAPTTPHPTPGWARAHGTKKGIASRQDVEDYARAKGITINQAEQEFRANGWDIQ